MKEDLLDISNTHIVINHDEVYNYYIEIEKSLYYIKAYCTLGDLWVMSMLTMDRIKYKTEEEAYRYISEINDVYELLRPIESLI